MEDSDTRIQTAPEPVPASPPAGISELPAILFLNSLASRFQPPGASRLASGERESTSNKAVKALSEELAIRVGQTPDNFTPRYGARRRPQALVVTAFGGMPSAISGIQAPKVVGRGRACRSREKVKSRLALVGSAPTSRERQVRCGYPQQRGFGIANHSSAMAGVHE